MSEKTDKNDKASPKVKEENSAGRKAESDKKDTILDKLPLKKWWFWAVVIVLLSMLGSAISNIGKSDKKIEVNQEYTDLKEVDLNGMTVAEACEAVRTSGWRVLSVVNENNTSEKGDCSDSAHRATRGDFRKEKYSVYNGANNGDYETVVIYYAGEQAAKNAKAEEAESAKSETKQETKTEQKTTSSSSSSSNSDSSTFRKMMSDYEGFMDKYVEFMKKYKNASYTEVASMMSDYADMMSKYSEWAAKIDSYNSDNLSADDWAYYLEVTARVLKKLSEVQ